MEDKISKELLFELYIKARDSGDDILLLSGLGGIGFISNLILKTGNTCFEKIILFVALISFSLLILSIRIMKNFNSKYILEYSNDNTENYERINQNLIKIELFNNISFFFGVLMIFFFLLSKTVS